MSTPTTRAQELIQAGLDGELSSAERAELAQLLLQDPAARQLQEDLRRTHELLREVPQAEPPAGLRPAIHRALGLTSGATTARSGSADWRSYRLAAAILGGLVVVGLGYGLLHDRPLASRDLQGSVTADVPDAQPVDRATIRVGEAEVTAELYRAGTGVRLELHSTGPGPVQVVARYDAAAMTARGEAGGGLIGKPGELTVDLAAGQQTRSIEFNGSAPIRLEVRSAGQTAGAALLGVDDAR